jgi:hypothetical protein
MIGRIILGAVLCVIGFYFVKKPHIFLDLGGSFAFADKWLGGSRGFYKLIGVVLIMVGFLAITGLHVRLLTWMAAAMGGG